MKFFYPFALLLFSLPAYPQEESFTIQVVHQENSRRGAAEGRLWDMESLVRSFEPALEFNRVNKTRVGANRCLRVKESEAGVRTLRNLLTQLRLRAPEMQQAGADFRVIYPSNCGGSERVAGGSARKEKVL